MIFCECAEKLHSWILILYFERKRNKSVYMSKKILVVPDVHGRIFWREPVLKYLDQVDRVVFLGDYFDPYDDEDGVAEDILANMVQILRLKLKNMNKVVLLKGNHDQHYSSSYFRKCSGSSRCDEANWQVYHGLFERFKSLFQLVLLDEVRGKKYLFSHAGLTSYWINKVNYHIWNLVDSRISVTDEDIIDRINALDDSDAGQEMLSTVGKYRSVFGEKTGSVLWADIREHPLSDGPKRYGLDKVFQVFGHTRLDGKTEDMLLFDHLAMVDTQKCFMIDDGIESVK